MKKFLAPLLFLLLAPSFAFAQASGGAPISPTPGFGPSQILSLVLGLSPLQGAWTPNDCLTVSASGPPYYVSQATCGAGGGITGPGTTVSGDIVTWNSATGTAVGDSGVSLASNTITGASSGSFYVEAGAGQNLYVGGNATSSYRFTASGNFAPSITNTGNIGVALSGVFFSSMAAQLYNIEGSSTGYDTLQSGNSTTTNRTLTIPNTGAAANTVPVGPSAVTSGDIVTYNGTTGVQQDSGYAFGTSGTAVPLLSGANTWGGTQTLGTLLGTSGVNLTINSASGKSLYLGSGSTEWVIGSSGALYPSLTNTYDIGASANFVQNVWTKSLVFEGTTVNDTITSGNSGSTARALSIPNTGNASDTFALLAAAQTFSAANTFSGAVSHTSTFIASGAGATSAANSTSIMGGLVAPTMGSNAGFLTIGGVYTLPTLATTGQGTISLSASNGLQIQGDGTSNDVCLMNKSAACVVGVKTGSGGISLAGALYNATTAKLFASSTAPTYGSGFGTSAALGAVNGTWKFDIAITTGTGATGIVNLPTATTDWNCFANSKSNPTTIRVWQTGFATNSATFAPYTAAGVLSAWASPDTIAISCFAN